MRSSGVSAVAIIGYGEVGRAFGQHISESATRVIYIDPALRNADVEKRCEIYRELPGELSEFDLVLAAVPSSACLKVAQEATKRPGHFVYVDLSSSAQPVMRDCAALFEGVEARFVDAAIMGSVDLAGADAPITLAGPHAGTAAAMLCSLGFNATALPGTVAGDASGLKLLRSILMKGIEALAVECFATSERMGLADRLRDNLLDVSKRPFPDLLDAMLRTHPMHAARRRHEVEAALGQAQSLGLDLPLTHAVLSAFTRTERALEDRPLHRSADIAEIIAWLSGDLESSR